MASKKSEPEQGTLRLTEQVNGLGETRWEIEKYYTSAGWWPDDGLSPWGMSLGGGKKFRFTSGVEAGREFENRCQARKARDWKIVNEVYCD